VSTEAARTGRETPTRSWGWLLLVPAVLWVGVFFLGPLSIVAGAAQAERGAPLDWNFTGSAWGRLGQDLHVAVLQRSVVLAVGSTLGCLLLGFPLCWWIVRQPARQRRFWYALVLLPMAANSLVLTYAWITLLRPDGLLEVTLRAVGWLGPDVRLGLLYTPGAVMLGLVYWYLPFFVYPLYASLEKFDFTLLDVARDLGASRLTAFRQVALPLLWPGLMTGMLLVFIQAFCSFVTPFLLGGGKSMMVGSLIQARFLNRPQDWPLGSALAVVVIVLMAAAAWAVLRSQRRMQP